MTSKTRIALITGASSGIGEATARLLAKNNFHLILCGRRLEKLEQLQNELLPLTKTIILTFDVRDKNEVEKAISSLPESWKQIDVLVNNAGNAHGLDPIQTGLTEDWDAMIDINVKGLLYVTHEVLPIMTERKSGHIVNIGSIAGKEVYPNGNVYSASKAAIDSLTRSMRIDLNNFGIKVSAVHPGLVETEFSVIRFKGDKSKADAIYKGIDPLVAEDIADNVLYIVTRPPHVVIAEITVMPVAQASATMVKRNA